MQLHPKWVTSDPEVLRLEDVLKSGLHDDLHEDEIEDLQLHGRVVGRAHTRDIAEIYPQSPPAQAVTQMAVAERRSRVPAAQVADEWFSHNYPKLKPEDLADHYRRNVLSPAPPARPVVSADPRGFDRYRDLLKAHVVNSNLAHEDEAESAEPERVAKTLRADAVGDVKAPTQLKLTPDMIARHRLYAPPKRRSFMARLGLAAMLTCVALLAGGSVGLLLADRGVGVLPPALDQDQESLMVPELEAPVKLRN